MYRKNNISVNKKIRFVFYNVWFKKLKENEKNLRKNIYYFSLLANNLFEKRVIGKVLEIRGSESRMEIFL